MTTTATSTTKTIGLLSLLHEPDHDHSAARTFRNQPVLWWTLARLAALGPSVYSWTVLCWGDQAESVAACVGATGVKVLSKGARTPIPPLDSISAASRWLDGWRGGLLQTCDFDRGFHPTWTLELLNAESADAVLLIDPSSGLVDHTLLLDLLAHADAHPDERLVFSQAAPGLSGVLLRKPILEALARTSLHPGKLLAYLHDQPGKDPIARDCCAPVPTRVARTTRRFKLDSARQVHRLTREMESLNGQLVRTGAEELVRHAEADSEPDALPREIVVELTTQRTTRPIFWPGRYQQIDRPPMSLETADRLFPQLAELPDTRVTFAGLGDPLLHPQLDEILFLARNAGLRSLHLETDLLGVSEDRIHSLPDLGLDILSFHVPAMTQDTYSKIMGLDAYLEVLDNLKRLVTQRHAAGRGVPVIVPTFVKCRANLAEMEAWYDQWLRVLGTAVITAPTSCGGLVPDDVGVANMEPPKRRPCPRLWSRLTLLSDGTAVRCEEDLPARSPIAHLTEQPIKTLWQSRLTVLRDTHTRGDWHSDPVCRNCKEWHRP